MLANGSLSKKPKSTNNYGLKSAFYARFKIAPEHHLSACRLQGGTFR